MKKPQDLILKAMDAAEFYGKLLGTSVDGRKNYLCPFPGRHKEGRDSLPSFRVFLDTGGTYCHGCGYKSTNPINFWADVKRVTYATAVRRLYSRYVEKLVPVEDYKGPSNKLLENGLVLDRVLKKRGLTRDTVKRYRIGYDGRRLTVPVFNKFGFCVNVRRYDLFKDGGPKTVSYKEGYGTARLYPEDQMGASSIVVVEGELDALAGIQAGLSCVSPSGGNQTWNDAWSKRFKGKTVYVVPDNDEPGFAGARKRVASISRYAASCAMVQLPVKRPGEDLTDWLLAYGGDAKKFRALAGKNGDTPRVVTPGPTAGVGFDILSQANGMSKSPSEQLAIDRAEMIWADLTDAGGFFKNADNELFYAREGMPAMRVTNSLGAFMSFLSSRSPLVNQATATGKFIYNHILYKAYGQSDLSKTGTWSMYDGGRLFVHAGKDKLLLMGDGKTRHIKNAINDHRVLLDIPVMTMAVTELPTHVPSNGLAQLKDLFMHNLAMSREDQYLLICWLACIFFRDYVKPKPVVRLLAKTASGKSTSSKLVSTLLYGEELLSHSASTVAATYEMSSRFPLVILDNIEARNMTPQLEDFLLVAATGGMKAKRQLFTDSGLVMQYTKSLILTNGIEPFSRHELIDRTMEIDLDLDKYGRRGFHEAKIFGELRHARSEIMSSLLYLIYRYVMPRIKKGEIHRIMREFGAHGKERFNEYLAIMCIMLDALWGYMPLDSYRRPHDLVNFWLDSQTSAEQKQDEGTNEVLYFLSTYTDRYEQLMGAQLKVEKSDDGGMRLRCTTRALLSDFRIMAKYLGMRCPWGNERQLGTRIADAEDVLNRVGWYRRQYLSAGKIMYEYKFIPKKEKSKHGDKAKKALPKNHRSRAGAGMRS